MRKRIEGWVRGGRAEIRRAAVRRGAGRGPRPVRPVVVPAAGPSGPARRGPGGRGAWGGAAGAGGGPGGSAAGTDGPSGAGRGPGGGERERDGGERAARAGQDRDGAGRTVGGRRGGPGCAERGGGVVVVRRAPEPGPRRPAVRRGDAGVLGAVRVLVVAVLAVLVVVGLGLLADVAAAVRSGGAGEPPVSVQVSSPSGPAVGGRLTHGEDGINP